MPEEHYVAFRAFRVDPQANPLKTPSEKSKFILNDWRRLRIPGIEKDEIIHPLPAYTPGFDGWDDPCGKLIHCS